MIISAKASEDIKNHTICAYSREDNTVRNLNDDFEDLVLNVCVYIDMCEPVGEKITNIKKDTCVRCRLIRIMV